MPGAGFKQKAKYWNVTTTACVEDPFAFVKEEVVRIFCQPPKHLFHRRDGDKETKIPP